ncbi:MAG: SLC13 family permease [Candidatus Eisenbacteria bacterium]|nr:SLC13 family permease [Candidatus Eisenbacteria bacterium]
MTPEIGILFAVLGGMAYLFFTEKLPVDLTAFAGLVILTLAGFLGTDEAFTGFASPAVITMFSVFFVSAGLLHTGVADWIGNRVHRLLGSRETPLIVAIMLVAGVLSAFMNNIAAAAVLLPAVASIAREAKVSPSRLFIPLSFGAILGGTTTLVGTPPNILADSMLRARGLPGFSLFDFTPIGAVLLGVGILFMATVGRRLLPRRSIAEESARGGDLVRAYKLSDLLFSIRIPHDSLLSGRTLEDSRLGAALGVQVVGILREGKRQLAPNADATLRGGDVLLVKGKFDDVQELFRMQGLELADARPWDLARATGRIGGAAARIASGSAMAGRTLRGVHFRRRFGAMVVGIRRDEKLLQRALADEPLSEGDEILVFGTQAQLEEVAKQKDFHMQPMGPSLFEDLRGQISFLKVPDGSKLAGASVAESRLGELTGLTVVGISRGEETLLGVDPEEKLRAGDRLLVAGDERRIRSLLALGDVQIQPETEDDELESEDVGIVEATLTPRSRAAGKSLRDLEFREKYGLQVLALWREGKPIHSGFARRPLRFGDALLLQGPWSRIRLLGSDPDFVVLSTRAAEPRRTRRAPVAVGALALLIALVSTGWQPIHVAAFAAAVFTVLGGAVTMEEAYRAVEWRAVFLVAAILPVGIAMERTGAAMLLSHAVTDLAGPHGPYAVLAGLVVLSSLLSQSLDGAPAVVLLTPVAIATAEELGMDPRTVMMGVGLAASAAFMTPFSHKANLLVMGAGGYRVRDYLRAGTPLTLILLALLVLLTPVFFPVR